MVQYRIANDTIYTIARVDKLGIEYPQVGFTEEMILNIQELPFTRCCFSIGDWAIVSALPEVMKQKYPHLQIYLPTPNWIRSVFGDVSGWNYQGNDPAVAVELVFKNNPHFKWFDVHQFSNVICDHDRCRRYENEPLVNQILRLLSFTEEDLSTYDTRPVLYFSEDEIKRGNEIINEYVNGEEYGCILFASRLAHLNNCWDENSKSIQNLIAEIKARGYNKDYKIFYYSTFDIDQTYWSKVFNIDIGNTFINFTSIPDCDQRIQWYIKTKAKFNISYQAGFNDATTRYSEHLVATHNLGPGETTMKGVTYFQNDGAIVKYK